MKPRRHISHLSISTKKSNLFLHFSNEVASNELLDDLITLIK
jgi:hypothetical protein